MVLEALLLALLLRLFPRLRPAAIAAAASGLGAPAIDLATPCFRPAECFNIYGRAPHAAVVALGLVPDWILVGAPGRGMRLAGRARFRRRPAQAARAPPTARRVSVPEHRP